MAENSGIYGEKNMKHSFGSLLIFITLIFSGCNKNETNCNYIEENVPLERNGVSLNLNSIRSEKSQASIGERNILFIHGLTFSSHEFNLDVSDYSLAKFFASKGYKVWLLDIAGYGLSGKNFDGAKIDSNYAAEDIFEAAKKICETTGSEKIDILGWSMGTVMAMKFAEKHGELINKMVLYAPIIKGLKKRTLSDSYYVPLWRHAVSDIKKTADGEIDYNITEKEVVLEYISNCWKYDGKGSPGGMRQEIFSGTDKFLINVENLGKVPTFVIYGEQDGYMQKDILETLRPSEMLKIKMIPGATHFMLLEKPFYKEFRKSVLEFLES